VWFVRWIDVSTVDQDRRRSEESKLLRLLIGFDLSDIYVHLYSFFGHNAAEAFKSILV